MEYAIESDGITVWVNTGFECIGRFGRMGIDIHRTMDQQMKGGSECLECTHGPVSRLDWERFKEAMLEYYGVAVDDEHMPARFRDQ